MSSQAKVEVQDSLFSTVAEVVPSTQDEASDDEDFDLAAMMAKQRQQAAALHQEAFKLRQASGLYALHCM
jgi:hypothetical protein